MAFSPDEIENREFTTGLRGYDVDEVTRFLKVVAQDYRMMASGVSPTGPETAEAPDLSHIGQEVNSILESANAAAVKLTEEAQARAASALEEAESRAAALVAEAEGKAREIVDSAEGRALEIVAGAERDMADRHSALEAEKERLAAIHATLRDALRTADGLFEDTRADVAQVASTLEGASEAPDDVVVGPPPAPPEPHEPAAHEPGPSEDFGAPVSIGRPDQDADDSDEPPAPPELSSTTG